MKQAFLTALMILIFTITGCRNIVESYESCTKRGPQPIVVSYKYNATGKTLNVRYEGAMLNCCLSSITADYELKGKTINIIVDETLRQACKCVCPYNINMKISNLLPGKYTLSIYRVSWHIDLVKAPLGKKRFSK
jgi:hypothetical protein